MLILFAVVKIAEGGGRKETGDRLGFRFRELRVEVDWVLAWATTSSGRAVRTLAGSVNCNDVLACAPERFSCEAYIRTFARGTGENPDPL